MTSQVNKPPLSFHPNNSSNNLRSLLVKNPNSQPFRFFHHQTPQKIVKNNFDSPNTQMDSKSPPDNSTLDVQSSGKKDSDCERSDPVSEVRRNIWDKTTNIDYERSNDSNSNSKDENQNMSSFLGTTFDNDLGYPPHQSLAQQLDEAKNGHHIIKQEDPFYPQSHQNGGSNIQENNHQQGIEGLEGLEDPTQMISVLMQLGISEAELAQLGIIQTEDGDKTPGEPNPELLMNILQKYGLLQDEGAGLQDDSQDVNVKNEEVYEEQDTHEEVELVVENGTNHTDQNNLDLNNMMSLLGNPDQLNSLVSLFSNGDFSEILNSLNQVNNNQDVIEINDENETTTNNGYRNYPRRNFNNNGQRFHNNNNRNNYNNNNNYPYRENTNPYNKGNRGNNGFNNNNNYQNQINQRDVGPRGFHYSALNSQAQQRPQNNFKRKIMTGNNTNPNNYPQNNNINNKGNLNSKYQSERRLNQQIFLRTPPSTTKSHLKAEKLLGIPLNELSAHRYDDETIVVTMNNEKEDELEPLVLQLHKEPTLRARRRGSGDSDIEEGEILIKKKRKLSPNYTDKIYSNINSVLQSCEENLKNARKSFLELIPNFDFDHPEKYLEGFDAQGDI